MAGLFDAETETLARAFAASSAAFLERLRWMTATLGRPYESFDTATPENWRPQLKWNPPEIDIRAFSTHARQTREGWLIAREFNAELSKFDCATLERLTSWILKTHGGSEVTTLRVAVVGLFKIMEEFVQVVLEFHQAVERFELVLSMTAAAVPVAAVAILEAVHLEPAAAAKLPKPDRTEKIWFPQDVEERIRLELNCGGETEKLYLFATADELESLIGCDRKTAMKTAFWTQDRIALRQAWRRENNAKKLT